MFRDDGSFGFPGGLVDPGESLSEAVNRECVEEIGLKAKHFVCESDLLFSTLCVSKESRWPGGIELHMFAKEVNEEEFKQIEKDVLDAVEYGREVSEDA